MESIELVELNLESALVEFESTHVRMGPAFFSILAVLFVFLTIFWALSAARGY